MAAPKGIGNEVKALLQQGRSYKEIHDRLSVSKNTISHHAAAIGLRSTLVRYDWAALQAVYDEGASRAQLKTEFGISSAALQDAVNDGRLLVRPESRKQAKMAAQAYAAHIQGNRNDSARGRLRAKVLEEGLIPYLCGICGISEWNGEPLTLTLDHRDGNSGNHQMENLRFLCPNCDSQQPTYTYRNRNRYKSLSV